MTDNFLETEYIFSNAFSICPLVCVAIKLNLIRVSSFATPGEVIGLTNMPSSNNLFAKWNVFSSSRM